MKNIVLTLLILLVSSCVGGEVTALECDYYFKTRGVKVCSQLDVSKAQVAQTVDWIEEKSNSYYPEIRNLPSVFEENNVIVRMYEVSARGMLAMGCTPTEYDNVFICDDALNGLNINGRAILVYHRPCLGITALAHELIHSVEILILSHHYEITPDMHNTPHLFYYNGETEVWNSQSVEYMVKMKQQNTFEECK